MWAPVVVLLIVVVAIIDLSVISFAVEQLSAPSDIQVAIGIASFAVLIAVNYLIIYSVVVKPINKGAKL